MEDVLFKIKLKIGFFFFFVERNIIAEEWNKNFYLILNGKIEFEWTGIRCSNDKSKNLFLWKKKFFVSTEYTINRIFYPLWNIYNINFCRNYFDDYLFVVKILFLLMYICIYIFL